MHSDYFKDGIDLRGYYLLPGAIFAAVPTSTVSDVDCAIVPLFKIETVDSFCLHVCSRQNSDQAHNKASGENAPFCAPYS